MIRSKVAKPAISGSNIDVNLLDCRFQANDDIVEVVEETGDELEELRVVPSAQCTM